MSKRVSQRTRTQLAFGTAVLLLLLSAIAAYTTVVRLRTAQRWVDHTRDVKSSLSDIGNLSSRAGRARTRYVDTGEESLLEEYQAAVSDLPAHMAVVENLTRDNQAQVELFRKLTSVTNRRLDVLNTSIQLKRSGVEDGAQQGELRQRIIDVSAEADSLIQKMQDNEQGLLELRTRHSEELFRITAYILCAFFVLALALFFLHYRMLNSELNAREQAESSLRTLSVRLLELQDQERRKFSRELHDSLGQYLVGAKMNLSMLGRTLPDNQLVSECLNLLDQAMTETRTISHLLHPPLLDETGFASAARWYVEGFSQRSGIQTSLDMPEEMGRLSPSLELALFRVLQESLTNVHRHSKSRKADVSVRLSESEVILRVRDYGQGIPSEVLGRFRNKRAHGGVGLAGMRERIHELGGTLEMDSDARGTQVVASMPRVQAKHSSKDFAAD